MFTLKKTLLIWVVIYFFTCSLPAFSKDSPFFHLHYKDGIRSYPGSEIFESFPAGTTFVDGASLFFKQEPIILEITFALYETQGITLLTLGSNEFPWQNYVHFYITKYDPFLSKYIDFSASIVQIHTNYNLDNDKTEAGSLQQITKRKYLKSQWSISGLEEGFYSIYASFDNTSIGDKDKQIWQAKLKSNPIKLKMIVDPKTNRETALYYESCGIKSQENEEWQSALEMYQNALKIDPTYTEIYGRLGGMYEKLNMEVQALEAYEKYLEHHPQHPSGHSKIPAKVKELRNRLKKE